MTPDVFLAALAIVCGAPVVITAMILISRHASRRSSGLPPGSAEEIMARLQRIQDAVDTSALEIERLAEANRFTARLIAERRSDPGDERRSDPR